MNSTALERRILEMAEGIARTIARVSDPWEIARSVHRAAALFPAVHFCLSKEGESKSSEASVLLRELYEREEVKLEAHFIIAVAMHLNQKGLIHFNPLPLYFLCNQIVTIARMHSDDDHHRMKVETMNVLFQMIIETATVEDLDTELPRAYTEHLITAVKEAVTRNAAECSQLLPQFLKKMEELMGEWVEIPSGDV